MALPSLDFQTCQFALSPKLPQTIKTERSMLEKNRHNSSERSWSQNYKLQKYRCKLSCLLFFFFFFFCERFLNVSLRSNKTLWERSFGRGRTTHRLLWTCLTAAKQLSSYLTREEKSFTLLVCWTTHYTVCPNLQQKSCHFMTMFENMHIFNADMLRAKFQHRA